MPFADVGALYLSARLIYLILHLLLLAPPAHMHGANVSATKIALCPQSCGMWGGPANFLLGNIILIQSCEVNTKKHDTVKPRVTLKETE